MPDINPAFPISRQGPDPDRLNQHLREQGIDLAAADSIDNSIPALALACLSAGGGSSTHPWTMTPASRR
ncbi:hypothetical protein [Nonomuraea aurantiaca]|uniref:hypothetical protein n=1 Tax=Nonomuraea aurantiaca TaxID=2878562 RepID=UPI0035571A9C